MNDIAVLLTCFNRKEITQKCLKSLFVFNISFDVYIVDDGSTDGTFEMIISEFPEVNIIKGDGNLFWNRGMHKAWEYAKKKNYEYYLWLNDDVELYNNAFEEILGCSKTYNHKNIISGLIETKDKSRVLYGGYDKQKKLIQSSGEMKPITYLNGNFVLVPKFVFNKNGNLDSVFHHDLGDVDYGLRALMKNIKIYSTRVPIGSGKINEISRERLNNTSLIKRFKRLYSPLGANPNVIFSFRKRHYGILNAIIYYIFLIGLNIIPDSVNTLLFKKKYK